MKGIVWAGAGPWAGSRGGTGPDVAQQRAVVRALRVAEVARHELVPPVPGRRGGHRAARKLLRDRNNTRDTCLQRKRRLEGTSSRGATTKQSQRGATASPARRASLVARGGRRRGGGQRAHCRLLCTRCLKPCSRCSSSARCSACSSWCPPLCCCERTTCCSTACALFSASGYLPRRSRSSPQPLKSRKRLPKPRRETVVYEKAAAVGVQQASKVGCGRAASHGTRGNAMPPTQTNSVEALGALSYAPRGGGWWGGPAQLLQPEERLAGGLVAGVGGMRRRGARPWLLGEGGGRCAVAHTHRR